MYESTYAYLCVTIRNLFLIKIEYHIFGPEGSSTMWPRSEIKKYILCFLRSMIKMSILN